MTATCTPKLAEREKKIKKADESTTILAIQAHKFHDIRRRNKT